MGTTSTGATGTAVSAEKAAKLLVDHIRDSNPQTNPTGKLASYCKSMKEYMHGTDDGLETDLTTLLQQPSRMQIMQSAYDYLCNSDTAKDLTSDQQLMLSARFASSHEYKEKDAVNQQRYFNLARTSQARLERAKGGLNRNGENYEDKGKSKQVAKDAERIERIKACIEVELGTSDTNSCSLSQTAAILLNAAEPAKKKELKQEIKRTMDKDTRSQCKQGEKTRKRPSHYWPGTMHTGNPISYSDGLLDAMRKTWRSCSKPQKGMLIGGIALTAGGVGVITGALIATPFTAPVAGALIPIGMGVGGGTMLAGEAMATAGAGLAGMQHKKTIEKLERSTEFDHEPVVKEPKTQDKSQRKQQTQPQQQQESPAKTSLVPLNQQAATQSFTAQHSSRMTKGHTSATVKQRQSSTAQRSLS